MLVIYVFLKAFTTNLRNNYVKLMIESQKGWLYGKKGMPLGDIFRLHLFH